MEGAVAPIKRRPRRKFLQERRDNHRVHLEKEVQLSQQRKNRMTKKKKTILKKSKKQVHPRELLAEARLSLKKSLLLQRRKQSAQQEELARTERDIVQRDSFLSTVSLTR